VTVEVNKASQCDSYNGMSPSDAVESAECRVSDTFDEAQSQFVIIISSGLYCIQSSVAPYTVSGPGL